MPYLPFAERATVHDGVFRWRLGVRPLDLAEWFEFGADALGSHGWIAEKQRVMEQHPTTAFAVLDDIEPESHEVAEAIAAHLAVHHVDQPRHLDTALHPLDAAARLVAEDLVLMVERNGRLVCGGGSVCFPNRWDLHAKLGRTMAEVHEPVADLNRQLAGPVDRFLDRLTPDRAYWRLGWGVLDVPHGYTPIDGSAGPRPDHPTPEDLFLRVERETLRRFPATHCVLFTIRTYVMPLRGLVRPELRGALATALAAMPDDIRRYKDVQDHVDALVDELHRTPLRS